MALPRGGGGVITNIMGMDPGRRIGAGSVALPRGGGLSQISWGWILDAESAPDVSVSGL